MRLQEVDLFRYLDNINYKIIKLIADEKDHRFANLLQKGLL
jgi:hypothetical protein